MSSTGAGASGGLSTLSTSLLAAFCTAVVAASIFVAVALRRYLRGRKRRSLMSAASSRPASAAAIYAQHIKAAKSISTDDIGEPRLNFAPERAHNAPYNMASMSLSQKTLVSMKQHNFFPMKAFPSPKFPNAALLSPRMQPPSSGDLPPPRSPLTPRSPGLTELTMSPGPSILLKPLAYGRSPRVPSPAPSKDSATDRKKESAEQKKKLTRSAVPSMLLRSLGVLPSSASQPALLQDDTEVLADPTSHSLESEKDVQEPSLTPILDLGIDFGNDESFEQALQLHSDFSFEDGSNTLGLSTSTAPQPPKQAQGAKVSAGMQSLIEALSPAQPEVVTLPGLKASPGSQMSALPSPASVRAHLPTPPPSQSLPPAPTSAPMHKMPSNNSLQRKTSRATAASTSSSTQETFHSATGSIGQICIDMAGVDNAPSPCLPDEDEQEVLESSYRPLSLGLGPAKSPSQGTFTKIFNGLRRPSKGSDVDLEAGNSTIAESMTSRSYSSDAMSYSSSQTSVDLEANSSIGKANIVPAASVPPLPPMPVSLLRLAEDKKPQASSTAALENQSDATSSVPTRPMRKRASTLGALDRPKLTLPDLMHPRAAPVPPSTRMPSPSINIEPVEVNRVSLMNLKAKSSDHLPLAGAGKSAMNFTSSYHRTLIPDPPVDGAHLSPGLGADSPIFAQLSPKLRSNSPSTSPKPGFTESLKARLSIPRKSLSISPGLSPKNSIWNLNAASPVPSPTGTGVDGAAAADVTPRMTSSRPEKSSARPATSPLLGQSSNDMGLGIRSPAILFNGQLVEPTKPLRFKKPASAGGRLGGSPQSIYSAASPSPMLHAGQWGTSPGMTSHEDAATPTATLYSPLIAGNDASLSPYTERIEFGVAASPDPYTASSDPAMTLQELPTTSPEVGDATPRPHSTSDSGALADEEDELEHLHYRDSVVSVAASTMSIMSNSTCMSDAAGDELDLAADRRARLLASVQQNVAKAQEKDAKRDSKAAEKYRQSQMPKTSSLRNIPEESSGTMGLGLFESEEEEEEEQEEEREMLDDSPRRAAGYGRKKPSDLILVPQDSRLVGPLTPPLTPIDGVAMYQSRHAPTASTSSASSASSSTSIPLRLRPSRNAPRNLAPIDTAAAGRLSPYGDAASSPSSLKLRPLSLAASLHEGSPMKRIDRNAFSPALPSPVPAHMGGDRSSRYNDEGRSSRSTTYRQGGILPIVGSKGTLESRRAEPSLTHSDSTTSMGSITSSLGSFSKMGQFPSPMKSSFGQGGTGKAMATRAGMGSRGSEDMPESSSVQSFASNNMGGRLGYKTSDLSVAI